VVKAVSPGIKVMIVVGTSTVDVVVLKTVVEIVEYTGEVSVTVTKDV
jgi:hypothetical protein